MTKLQEKKIPKYQIGGKDKSLTTPSWIEDLANTAQKEQIYYSPEEYFAENPDEYESYNPTQFDMRTASYWEKQKEKLIAKEKEKKRSQLSDEYPAGLTGFNPASLLKPALGATAVIAGYQNLKNTRDTALNIKSPRIEAPMIANRPIQGLDRNIIDLFLKSIGGLKVKKTSDSVANILSEQMLNLNKMEALDKLAAKQTDTLLKERDRYDKTDAANRLAAVKARTEESKFATDLYNKKSAINAAYLKSKGDWTTRAIDEIIGNVDKRIYQNVGADAMNLQAEIGLKNDLIVHTTNQLKIDPTNTTLRSDLNRYREELEKSIKQVNFEYYDKIASSWIKSKNKK